MKITIIGSYPDPKINKEIKSLKNNGYEVNLILWERGMKLPEDNGHTIKKFRTNSSIGSLSTILFLPFWWMFIIYNLIHTDQKIIHSINLDTYIIALLIAKLKNKYVVYDIFDFYGETAHILPKFIRDVIVFIDKKILNYADLIIIADDSRLEQINFPNNNIIIINNSPVDVYSKENNQKNKDFTIFYGGQVIEERWIEGVINCLKELDINLKVMGYCNSIEYKKYLLNLSKEMKNVVLYLTFTPHDKIIEETQKADVIFSFYDPKIPNNRYASPNKLFEAMMCGKPILVNSDTSMAKIVSLNKCGLIIEYGNEEELKNNLLKLIEDKELLKNLGLNARKTYENKYNWTIMEKRLINAYKHLK